MIEVWGDNYWLSLSNSKSVTRFSIERFPGSRYFRIVPKLIFGTLQFIKNNFLSPNRFPLSNFQCFFLSFVDVWSGSSCGGCVDYTEQTSIHFITIHFKLFILYIWIVIGWRTCRFWRVLGVLRRVARESCNHLICK